MYSLYFKVSKCDGWKYFPGITLYVKKSIFNETEWPDRYLQRQCEQSLSCIFWDRSPPQRCTAALRSQGPKPDTDSSLLHCWFKPTRVGSHRKLLPLYDTKPEIPGKAQPSQQSWITSTGSDSCPLSDSQVNGFVPVKTLGRMSLYWQVALFFTG